MTTNKAAEALLALLERRENWHAVDGRRDMFTEKVAAIIAEATAQQAAEVARLRDWLWSHAGSGHEIQAFAYYDAPGTLGYVLCRADPDDILDMERAALAATPVAPAAPDVLSCCPGAHRYDETCLATPPAPATAEHHCRECDDGPHLSFQPEPRP